MIFSELREEPARNRQGWQSEFSEQHISGRCYNCMWHDGRPKRRLCVKGEFLTQPMAGCLRWKIKLAVQDFKS